MMKILTILALFQMGMNLTSVLAQADGSINPHVAQGSEPAKNITAQPAPVSPVSVDHAKDTAAPGKDLIAKDSTKTDGKDCDCPHCKKGHSCKTCKECEMHNKHIKGGGKETDVKPDEAGKK